MTTLLHEPWIGLQGYSELNSTWRNGQPLTYFNFDGTLSFDHGSGYYRLRQISGYTWHDMLGGYNMAFICETEKPADKIGNGSKSLQGMILLTPLHH